MSIYELQYIGELVKAAGHFEEYKKVASKHKWCTDMGDSVHEIACEHLRRVYTSMAKQVRVLSIIAVCEDHVCCTGRS